MVDCEWAIVRVVMAANATKFPTTRFTLLNGIERVEGRNKKKEKKEEEKKKGKGEQRGRIFIRKIDSLVTSDRPARFNLASAFFAAFVPGFNATKTRYSL